jgi:hypothetical protein
MSWSKDFCKGWDDLVKAQRLDKATYVVEAGIEAGHSIHEIERSLTSSECPVSRQSVQRYIDLYAFQQGAQVCAPPSAMQLVQARKNWKPEIDQEEIDGYVAETGASPDVARRILSMKQIGETMREQGLIGNGKVNLKSDDSERLKQIRMDDRQRRSDIQKARDDHEAWMRAFNRFWQDTNTFLAFLRETKQDAMKDSTIPNKLRRIAAQLEAQSDRFEVGYEKQKARKAARTT